jgi:endonuclease/exonuclease/phosphatase family metal-dependent hydrolase
VQNYDIIDYCTDIDLIIDKASEEFQDIFIMGDMNARNSLFWNEDITNTEGSALNALFHNFDFEQLIHEPTRIVGNTKSCLDLLFTNNCLAVSEVGTRDKIVNICDHHPIYATLKHTKSRPKSYKRWVWDFKRGEYDQFSQLL